MQVLVSGMAEMDFTNWISLFYLIQKVPILLSIWLQTITLSKAMRLDSVHWKTAGKQCAAILATVAISTNFFEWVAQFVKRRFTIYILDSGEMITPMVAISIALSEILYPALSFYYFHALLCWLVVGWRIIFHADKQKLKLEEEEIKKET